MVFTKSFNRFPFLLFIGDPNHLLATFNQNQKGKLNHWQMTIIKVVPVDSKISNNFFEKKMNGEF